MDIAHSTKNNVTATNLTRKRYQRLAWLYDMMQGIGRGHSNAWRQRLWGMVRGPRILEVGVGTGRNIPYYPEIIEITAIDLTPGMLARATILAGKLNRDVNLRIGDVQNLDFPSASFDGALATCVFCSVPDPILGFSELKRVVKPGGQILLLEHVRSRLPLLGTMMDLLNPLVVRMMGANINRQTVENVQHAGLIIDQVEDLDKIGMFCLIQARVP